MEKSRNVRFFISSILNSYSQTFFAEDNYLFSLLLLFTSFFDLWLGIYGLVSVLAVNSVAYLLGYNKYFIEKGLYGFNALLVGIGIGVLYVPSTTLLVIIIFSVLLTLFLTIALQGILGKYGLPYLSIPFIVVMWIVIMATRNFPALGLAERGIYTYNELYALGGNKLVELYNWLAALPVAKSIKTYFYSLGAIYFQNNILTGIITAIGLIYFSRIAFSLSVLGFYIAYLFYQLVGGDFYALSYTFIGFNYILTAIAIGGYFLVPSKTSYLWVILLLPITVLLTFGLSAMLSIWSLSIYSLPFNIIVLLFIYSLKLRTSKNKHLEDNFVRLKNPEQTLYLYKTVTEKFKSENYIPINLPFKGEWQVMQGHNGKYTHKDEWQHAWDFVIIDENGKSYKNKGDYCEDYYCYGKPVFAPYYGYVVGIADGIPDNAIGEVNTEQNWGNTIVIKHSEYLYSQVSHLKSGSIKVKIGDYVKKGDMIGVVGNSGHSPYPHLHFQLQAFPHIGSKTIDYPLHNYIRIKNNLKDLIIFGKPEENEIISPTTPDNILKETVKFIPGKVLEVFSNNNPNTRKWLISKDIYNQTFIVDKNTNSYIYFYSNEVGIFFTNFKGDTKSDLFMLFQAIYNLPVVIDKNISISNKIRPDLFFKKHIMWIQDFVAPFIIFSKVKYTISYISKDDELFPTQVTLKSNMEKTIFNKSIQQTEYYITITKQGIVEIKNKKTSQTLTINMKK